MIEHFLTTEQVANILQVHPLTILKFIKQGKLKGVKIGRVYRIQESDVREFLEARMTGKTGTKSASHPEKPSEPKETPAPARAPEKSPDSENSTNYYII